MDSNDTPLPPARRSVGDRRRRLDPEAAFRIWAAMGPSRSYSAVATELGVADSTVLRVARRRCWDERLAALERPAKESGDEALRQVVQEMNERHVAVARKLVEKGAAALCFLEPSSVAEALRLVETGAKLERQALGEPDSKKQVTVETILRERFEALVVHDDARSVGAPPRRTITIDVPSLGDEEPGRASEDVPDSPAPSESPRPSLGIFASLIGQPDSEEETDE